MTDTPGTELDAFAQQVALIRARGVLGRSHGLRRLFDHLAANGRGAALSENDVAHEVFGRAPDPSGDASVRVYIHRLRRKLEAFYAAAGADEPYRLVIPLGEYRLDLTPQTESAISPAIVSRPSWSRRWVVGGGLALLALNLLVWALLFRLPSPDRELASLRRLPVWSALAHDSRPLLIVVGDYYIFGDTAGGVSTQRLVREFGVNSALDLDDYLMRNPQFEGRYQDLDLHYTALGSTLALRKLMPLLDHLGPEDRVQMITASELRPEMLKSANIVYVGYFSSLGLLQEPIMGQSSFAIGETFDELINRRSNRRYVSEAGSATRQTPHLDYAYVASFVGPAGNRFVVAAGTRDIGLLQAAEALTDVSDLRALTKDAARPATFEGLYEVRGLGRTNLSATLVSRRPGA